MYVDQVIIRPIVTEKSTLQQKGGKYSFAVNKKATKIDVKKAIKQLYGVDVLKVNIISTPGKERLAGRGRIITKRKEQKKVMIIIESKQSLDIHKLVGSKK